MTPIFLVLKLETLKKRHTQRFTPHVRLATPNSDPRLWPNKGGLSIYNSIIIFMQPLYLFESSRPSWELVDRVDWLFPNLVESLPPHKRNITTPRTQIIIRKVGGRVYVDSGCTAWTIFVSSHQSFDFGCYY